MKYLFLLFISLTVNVLTAQKLPNDCVNALIVCGNSTFFSNASGAGNFPNEINGCSGKEEESLWLKITIAQAGTLGFELIPNDPSLAVDYDFWVYSKNLTCATLGSPIRCCTTNPILAGLPNNTTGMNGTSSSTTAGPGANGNGYVRWLNVAVGDSYYIAIDRPEGDGGFQLKWTGSATLGTGAFPEPPIANKIPDYVQCSSTTDVAIFDLNSVSDDINPNTTDNTVTYFESIENATDNINALFPIYATKPGQNPQKIFARVTNNLSGCYSLTEFNLVVNLLPTAAMNLSQNEICLGDTVDVIFSGTPDAVIEYTINNSGKQTATLDASGEFILKDSPKITTTYTLETIKTIEAGTGITRCTDFLNISATVNVNPIPVVSIAGTTTICSGTTTDITFTGTPNATVNYTVDGLGAAIILDTAGNATVTTPILSNNSLYQLISVSSPSTLACTQLVSENALVTVLPLPTAKLSGTTTICAGTSTIVSFIGTPNAIVSYTVDSSPATIILDATGNASITTPDLVSNSIYELVSVSLSGSTPCTQLLSGSAIITVKPSATITATPSSESFCSGNSTNILLSSSNPSTTFTWTANATNVSGSGDGTGNTIIQNLTTITSASGVVIYTILSQTNGCDELPINVTVNVSPKPVATSDTAKNPICSGEKTNILLESTISGTTFSWTTSQVNATGATTGSGNSIQQILTTTGNSQGTVNYTVTPNNNGCIGLPISVEIVVNPFPVATATSTPIICNHEASNIVLNSSISGTNFSWIVNETGVTGASAGTGNLIVQNLNLTTPSNGKVLYSITPSLNGCNGFNLEVTVDVKPLPEPTLQSGTICVDQDGIPVQTYTLDTGLNNTSYTFEWFYNGVEIPSATKSIYEATKIGTYSVVATDTTLGCKSEVVSALVNESIPGKSMTLSQSEYFSDNATIYVTVNGGDGTYIYQLDNGAFQSSSVFSNVTPGEHKVTVNDTKGCTNLSDTLYIVGYPKFFTPNGDGYNDTWNILNTESISYKSIRVFDRFGKLLIQLNPNSKGWDGTFNGKMQPSSDYWFTFDYAVNGVDQTFKAHFSLKR